MPLSSTCEFSLPHFLIFYYLLKLKTHETFIPTNDFSFII